MTKKVIKILREKYRGTPSVTASGDTNLSDGDAIGKTHNRRKFLFIELDVAVLARC